MSALSPARPASRGLPPSMPAEKFTGSPKRSSRPMEPQPVTDSEDWGKVRIKWKSMAAAWRTLRLRWPPPSSPSRVLRGFPPLWGASWSSPSSSTSWATCWWFSPSTETRSCGTQVGQLSQRAHLSDGATAARLGLLSATAARARTHSNAHRLGARGQVDKHSFQVFRLTVKVAKANKKI